MLIAFPLAWWVLHQWLDRFAYRVSIGPGDFLIAGVSVLGISLITVSYQAIRSAISNPIDSLKTE